MKTQKTLEHLYKEVQKAESLVNKTVKEATTLWMAYCTEQDTFIATRILRAWEVCMAKKRLLHQDHMAKLKEFASLSSSFSINAGTIPNTNSEQVSSDVELSYAGSHRGYALGI